MSKGLEALERLYCAGNLKLDYVCSNKHKEDYNTIEKELKALELIKPLVELTKGKHHCWLWIGLNGMNITQEQYDLLKEVLKDETSNND